jgi:radical SAM protein with 4Fe4S-binding SPASM domain
VTARWVPRVCVWEITLACDQHCVHCGSSAGEARSRELDGREALALICELSCLGCESVTLSGGEPLVRSDWPLLARAIRASGMRVELITGGLSVSRQVDAITQAGFFGVTFSVDGTAATHDRLRGVRGGLDRLLAAARALEQRGVRIGAVTQVNRLNLPHLGEIHQLLVEHGFRGWQVQLTMPHGRAAERARELCLRPEDLPALETKLRELQSQSTLFLQAADNLGYMGRHEPALRSGKPGVPAFWGGCRAGLEVVGITSDGGVRGCLSLPPVADEGNVRDRSLGAIWQDPDRFAYNRKFRREDLSGPCQGCVFGALCRGGCRSLAYATSPGCFHANPYCISRVARASG